MVVRMLLDHHSEDHSGTKGQGPVSQPEWGLLKSQASITNTGTEYWAPSDFL